LTTAKVIGLTRYHQKGEPGEPLQELNLIKDVGIEGDYHQGGIRQVSILTAEALRWMETQPAKGLCFKKFRANMLIDGLNQSELADSRKLYINETILKIVPSGKHCFRECVLFSDKTPCLLLTGAVFAAVFQSGTIKIGDEISVYLASGTKSCSPNIL